MRKMNRVIYFVEGECEAKLINALKEAPAVIRPGKIKIINVIQNVLSSSQLVQIQAGTTVVLVFDTDVPKTDCLQENIRQLRKKCTKVELVFLAQVRNFEEELVRCTDVERASELTHSRSNKDFQYEISVGSSQPCFEQTLDNSSARGVFICYKQQRHYKTECGIERPVHTITDTPPESLYITYNHNWSKALALYPAGLDPGGLRRERHPQRHERSLGWHQR